MKHRPIIQANLDKRTTKKEKISYLAYAYKEWLIGIGLTLALILFFVLTHSPTTQPDLTIRVISDEPLSEETLENFTTTIQEHADEELQISIQNVVFGTIEQQLVMMTQVSAREIDLFGTADSASSEIHSLITEMTEQQQVFSITIDSETFTFYQALNTTKSDELATLKKAFEDE